MPTVSPAGKRPLADLHMHTLFSDGALLPEELARRAAARGYTGVSFTDHAGPSNWASVIEGLLRGAEAVNLWGELSALAGVEITHVAPQGIAEICQAARAAGARIIVVHGETTIEPVAAGTNHAAIEARVDVLAHPGLISEDDARLAAQKGVALELTARAGHGYTNGHVAALALKHGATLVLDSDTHQTTDLLTHDLARIVARGAGLSSEQAEKVIADTAALFAKLSGKKASGSAAGGK